MSSEDELSPKDAARIRSRERKSQPPRMVVDNAGVRRIQLALEARARRAKARPEAAPSPVQSQPQAASNRGKSGGPTARRAKSRSKDRPVK